MNRSTKYAIAIIGWIGLVTVPIMLAQSPYLSNDPAYRGQQLFGFALASGFAAVPGIVIIALVWLKHDDIRNEISGMLRHPYIVAHYLIAFGVLVILTLSLYTYFAIQYLQMPSNFSLASVFIFLALPIASTAIYYSLRAREKDLKKVGKFTGAAFVAMYATVYVYAMMTSEQYSLSRNIFESEALWFEVMFFVAGLLFNWFVGKMLGWAIFAASGKTTVSAV